MMGKRTLLSGAALGLILSQPGFAAQQQFQPSNIVQPALLVDCTTTPNGNCPLSAIGGYSAGAIIYGGVSSWLTLSAGTSGQVLTSGGAGAPSWTTLPAPSVASGLLNQFAYYPANGSAVAGTTFSNLLLGPNVNNVVAYGADPTGASITATTAAFNAAEAAALAGPTGGLVYVPCGKYTLTSGAVVATIPTNKSLTFIGGGQDCTVISSPSGGSPLRFTKVDTSGSYHIRDISIVATAVNTGIGLLLDTSGTFSTSSVPSDVSNVTLHSSDAAALGTNSFNKAISAVGVGGLTFDKISIQGPTIQSGIGVATAGNASGAVPIIYNFSNCNMSFLGVGFQYGTNTQGVTMVNADFTGNLVGIQSATGATGLFELVISSSQFQDVNSDISTAPALISDIDISSSNFGPFSANTGFVSIGGTFSNMTVSSSTFINGTGATSNQAFAITGTSDSVAIVGNVFSGFWTLAVGVAGGATNVNLQSNIYHGPATKSSPATTTGSVVIGGGSQ